MANLKYFKSFVLDMQKKDTWKLNRNIILLGIVSFLTDVSSEMIFSVFSIFFTVILGASVFLLGVVEGLADFSASALDYVSGFLSDRTGKRKKYAILGYGFSTIAKSILLVANSVLSVFVFRIVERLGKSFRGPPRDAWIGSLAPKKIRGYAFGVHKALDKSGAILGPLIAYAILYYFGQNLPAFKMLFIAALVPAAAAVILLFFIKEKYSKPKKSKNPFLSFKFMKADFRHYLATAGIFSLAYFSFGFLLLKAYLVGFEIKDVVLLYALFNVAFVIAAPLIGKLGDFIGRKKIVLFGYFTYFIMSMGFLLATTKFETVLLFVLFGIFYAIDESQSKAYISDMEKSRRATAIGIYNFVTGLIYLPASIIAGLLWRINPNLTFAFAAVISIATILFFMIKKKRKQNGKP
ncbi:MAG: MFS transporter [Candidatus Nanoarchaeia archaeon]|nr:MFS transporter [Candidatus Nanoarchaeia archaeon]